LGAKLSRGDTVVLAPSWWIPVQRLVLKPVKEECAEVLQLLSPAEVRPVLNWLPRAK
jgi:hypothetical protein